MRVEILRSARRDLAAATRFYENQQERLGYHFLDSLETDIQALGTTAGIHVKISGFHRKLSKPFRYAIYYEVDETVKVRAVLDCRRDPQRIERQLRKRSGE